MLALGDIGCLKKKHPISPSASIVFPRPDGAPPHSTSPVDERIATEARNVKGGTERKKL